MRNRLPKLLLHLFIPCALAAQSSAVERVYTEVPITWFEESSATARISPDGDWAVYGARGKYRLIDLTLGRDDSVRMRGPLDEVSTVAFMHDGTLVRSGRKGNQRGWFVERDGALQTLQVPGNVIPVWSNDGRRVAYISAIVPTSVVVQSDGDERPHELGGVVTGLAWGPQSGTLYAVVREESGLSSLVQLDVGKGETRTIAKGLDSSPTNSPISLADDERTLFIGLASAGSPRVEVRHDPTARRNVQLYAVNLANGSRRRITTQSTGEDIAPVVAAGHVYWIRTNFTGSVVVLPARGDTNGVTAATNAMLPLWSPDGKSIAYTNGPSAGGWRTTDSPLNMDGAVVRVNATGHPIGAAKALVTGYHEDFTPAYSPQGNWIAYHSHRPQEPVFLYGDPRSHDEMYIRRPWEPTSKEIALTDFGWEVGWADWSPDGSKVLFSSWVKGKPPGTSQLWVVTIDTANGSVLQRETVKLPDAIRTVGGSAWSPDGEHIAVEDQTQAKTRAI